MPTSPAYEVACSGGCGRTTRLCWYYLGERFCEACFDLVLEDIKDFALVDPLDRIMLEQRVVGYVGLGLGLTFLAGLVWWWVSP